MKKLFYIFVIFVFTLNISTAQKVCCPEFKLTSSMGECFFQPSGTGVVGQYCQSELHGCKHTKEIFAISPLKIGYTYSWTVTGGTITSTTGNPKEITWGSGSLGTITVVISNQDGSCKQTISEKICLLDAPIANFSFTPNSSVCANQLIQFNNSSSDAKSWSWDFGDGTTSTLENPNHTYAASGTYTITLTVSNIATSPGSPIMEKPCGCSDIITKTIKVGGPGITIIPGCKQMFCKGDKSTYTTASPCNNYNWSVTGGHIEGSANNDTVTVVWDGSYPATVNMTGNCIGSCDNSGTLNVPVLYPTMPITGATTVCPLDFTSYTLPSMPGTNYAWTISGGGTIAGYNANTSVINVNWGNSTGEYTITCNYNNPMTKCNGTATIKVKVLPHFNITGSSNGCKNETFSYTANGVANWTITPSTGHTPPTFPSGSTISGTWTTPGTYTISATPVTPTNFCSYPDTIVVTVLDKPILNVITGPTTICPGKPYVYNITSNRPGGFFNWTVSGGTYATSGVNQNTITVTWNATGPYNLSVNQTVDSCSAANNQTLTVNPYPKPIITGSSTSCMDTELIYTTTSPAVAGDYNWTVSNPLGTIISGQGTNTIHIMWHGVLPPNPNTCNVILVTCGGSDQITVTINPAPPVNITKSGTLCSTTGITLTSSISGATSYSWSFNGVNQPSLSTQTITISNSGTYAVIVKNTNGCISNGSIVVPSESVNFNANIAASNQTYWLCTETISTNLTATPSSGSGYCYQWFRANSSALTDLGSSISGATSQNYTATLVGYFWCEVSICYTSCKAITGRVFISKQVCPGGGGSGSNCNPNYTANFTNSNCNPYTFTGSTNPSGIGIFKWNFGDGTSEESGNSVTHLFNGIGTYNVCAYFGGGTYCEKKVCKTVTVNLAANFNAYVSCDKVTITNLCQVQAPSTITSYNWSFPGGSPSSSTSATPPVITYTTGGTHTATLTITDGICPITFSQTYTTTSIPATMNIPSIICANSIVPFSVTCTNPSVTYQWNFGDGYVSNLKDTDHTYATSGSKTVTLTITQPNGCNAILTQTITISSAISASIGGDKKLCQNGKVTLSVSPSTFTSYHWYKDGVEISGATSATYDATLEGTYWVLVQNGTGCSTYSNHSNITFYPLPTAKIITKNIQCSSNSPINIQNSISEVGASYSWTVTGPAPLTLSNVYNPTATATVSGDYNFELTVTDANGCKAKDATCVTLVQSPTITITGPTGQLCEGHSYTFTAVGTSNTNPSDYIIKWSNGVIGNTMTTGLAGSYSATIANAAGCTANAFAGNILPVPDVSLFPKGCQTLCWTDTVSFPLPSPSSSPYTITWYDDDGTAVATVGSGNSLALSSLQPGIHHLHATVSISGGCLATTGVLDLNIKDCTLLPECDNCKDLLTVTKAESNTSISSSSNALVNNENLTFTILKPVKEVRISMADLKYYWKDPACANCKIQMLERGCLFAQNMNQVLGTLLPDSNTASITLSSAVTNKCQDELIWYGGTALQPGTYTIPLQLSLPKGVKDNCVLVLEKACFHLTLIDEDCKKCETIFCKKDLASNPNECACNDGNNWSNLFLTPSKPGIAKPRKQIICGDTMTDIESNFAYTLSGVYNCKGKCASIKNEITVYNQVNQIIYTHVATALYETIIFPEKGMYSVTLTATCGNVKCTCSFRITVDTGSETGVPTGNGDPTDPKNPKDPQKPIDEIVKGILPPDFNGEVLVSQNDNILFEKYYSYKDNVTSHTAFDLASVTKTFTAMAVLKLMEEGKLNVDDAVSKYLPEFPIKEITLKMLLSHKSGLEDYLKFIDESSWDKSKNLTNNDLLQFIAKNKSKVLINTPGKIFDYSNTNFALLALVIEKVSNQSYKDYLSNTFFKPLQMNDTYVMGLDNYAGATKSYYKNGKVYSLRYLDLVYGDKNVYSTVLDLKKWDKALRDGKMFKKATLDLAYAPTSTLTPFVSNYGLGWKKIVTTNGNEIIYHTGWWAGNRSLLIRLPKENVMIAVVSNNNFTNISDIRKLCDLFGDYKQTGRKIDNF